MVNLYEADEPPKTGVGVPHRFDFGDSVADIESFTLSNLL
jgi:hypothetical protein